MKMKKIFYLYVLLVTLLWSCVSLDEEPRSILTTDQFYNTKSDALAAVDAIYYNLDHSTDNIPFALYSSLFNTGMDMATDDVHAGPGSPNPDVRSISILSFSSINVRVLQIWQANYASINRANVAIGKIPDINIEQEFKNRLLGEAHFLRALYYFNLVRLYGDIPLLLTDQTVVPIDQLKISRSSKEEVYEQIIIDLETDADYFSMGSTPDPVRATEGAAKALLSNVYLTMRDWDNAVKSPEV